MSESKPQRPSAPEARTVPILERLTAARSTLSRSERRVADVVLDEPFAAVGYTMAQLAARAEVSEPTIMRFCLAVGSTSFQSFRLELAQAVALGLPLTHSAIGRDDSPEQLIGKVFDHTIASLDRARRGLDPVAVSRAIETITQASHAFFIGFGASGIVAGDAQQKFPLFGIPCEAYIDDHQQFIAASMSGPRSVCVAISNTGRTVGVLRTVEEAKRRGCPVIALSGEDGRLLELADVGIRIPTFDDTDVYTPSTSRLAALTVIDILATGVALRQPEAQLRRLREMKAALSAMRTGDDAHDCTRSSDA